MKKSRTKRSSSKDVQLGKSGKEGTTYLVNLEKKYYAMKTFKKTKSTVNILKESEFQETASISKIAPKVYDVNLIDKYILMEVMDELLIDKMKRNDKTLDKKDQKRIIKIFETLDTLKILHNDPNLLNFMIKKNKIYIIDFGCSKKIDSKVVKKGGKHPNIYYGISGIIRELKRNKADEESYKYLLKKLEEDDMWNEFPIYKF
jgi:predicted Ser/Thr protein kinase